ncbi:Tripartite tricarboxylate transporter TctA family protein [compost metagenome]
MANLILLPIGYLAIRSAHIFAVTPTRVLMPIILCFCIVGAFAINNSLTDIWIMLACGIVAYMIATADFPIAPAILGLVLGNILESNFMSSMIKADGNLLAFVERPISASLALFVLLIALFPLLAKLWRTRYPAALPPTKEAIE